MAGEGEEHLLHSIDAPLYEAGRTAVALRSHRVLRKFRFEIPRELGLPDDPTWLREYAVIQGHEIRFREFGHRGQIVRRDHLLR